MSENQCYNAPMSTEFLPPQAFAPERLSSRGEITAWALTLVVLMTAAIVQVNGSRWASAGWILAGIFLLSAGSISLGNWMDRKTVIHVDRTGISFQNGLRDTTLTWKEVRAVRVLPAQWGAQQVQVVGETSHGKAHFEFRTLGTIHHQGQERGRTGFASGDQILDTIIRMANMQPVPSDNPTYSYYARK
jgi:hypothetical protein